MGHTSIRLLELKRERYPLLLESYLHKRRLVRCENAHTCSMKKWHQNLAAHIRAGVTNRLSANQAEAWSPGEIRRLVTNQKSQLEYKRHFSHFFPLKIEHEDLFYGLRDECGHSSLEENARSTVNRLQPLTV